MKLAWIILLSSCLAVCGSVIAAPEPSQPSPSPTSSAQPTPTLPPEPSPTVSAEPAPISEAEQQQKLIAADRLHRQGEYAEAEKLYRQAKAPFSEELVLNERPRSIDKPEQLPPAGQVYWREAEAGKSQNSQTREVIALKLLVEQFPQFVPAHLQLAEALNREGQTEKSLQVLDRAVELYPDQPTLITAKLNTLTAQKQWLDASLTARQFTLLYPDRPETANFEQQADAYFQRYKNQIKGRIRNSAIANALTGVAGYVLTGSIFGPISAADSAILLIRGEAAVGESVARQVKRQLKLIEDETVTAYINRIGEKLSQLSGRKDFQYEFYVIKDKELNAFALPGGKIFVNAGAITKSKSEAELAGLMAHEMAHGELSHVFQLIVRGNLLASLTQYVPLGGTAADLLNLNYSRSMERQADVVGTRMLALSGYAADGLRNLTATLETEQKYTPPRWLSSHPAAEDRVQYLEALIQRNRYNRYAYEGVESHQAIQKQVKILLAQEQTPGRKNRLDRQRCTENKTCKTTEQPALE
jgi:Zn-dependent protease with chaperone function